MRTDLKLISIIIATIALMFLTSLLLELEIVMRFLIRELMVYLTMAIEFLIGLKLVSYLIRSVK